MCRVVEVIFYPLKKLFHKVSMRRLFKNSIDYWSRVLVRLHPQASNSQTNHVAHSNEKNRNRLALYAILLVSPLFVFFFLYLSFPEPPVQVIHQSGDAISRARNEEAFRYAPELYRSALLSWQTAFMEWQRQNAKIFLKRDFTKTDSIMRASYEQANEAIRQTHIRRDSLATFAHVKLDSLNQHIAQMRTEIDRVSVRSLNRKKFAEGQLSIMEGQEALNRQDYLTAVEKINQGEILLAQVEKTAREKFENYLLDLPKWKTWVSETMDWSRHNNAVIIIVEKLLAKCLLFSSGELIAEFSAEFGPEWLGHKQQRGDGATPEGQYFVTKKRDSNDTNYYKALEINYPNENDQREFAAAKQNGLIPQDAHIGGLIEIHGEGGKGVNWTKGCVALRNEDMDEVFNLAQVGTPVTIVGMMKTQ